MNGFQTELEKRWAAEEAEQIKTSAVSEEFLEKIGNLKDTTTKVVEKQMDEPENLDGVELGDSDLYLNTPLTNEQEYPLVLITCGHRAIMGGLIDMNSSGVFLHCPMSYFEIPNGPDKLFRFIFSSPYETRI